MLHGTLAHVVLAVVWGGALAGVVLKLVWIDAPKWLISGVYVAIGWVGVITLPQLLSRAGVGAVGTARDRRPALHRRRRDLRG